VSILRTCGSVMRSIRVRQIALNREWRTCLDADDYTGMARIEARLLRLDRHADRVVSIGADQEVAAFQGALIRAFTGRNEALSAGSRT
jgi:hypothetical protein